MCLKVPRFLIKILPCKRLHSFMNFASRDYQKIESRNFKLHFIHQNITTVTNFSLKKKKHNCIFDKIFKLARPQYFDRKVSNFLSDSKNTGWKWCSRRAAGAVVLCNKTRWLVYLGLFSAVCISLQVKFTRRLIYIYT